MSFNFCVAGFRERRRKRTNDGLCGTYFSLVSWAERYTTRQQWANNILYLFMGWEWEKRRPKGHMSKIINLKPKFLQYHDDSIRIYNNIISFSFCHQDSIIWGEEARIF